MAARVDVCLEQAVEAVLVELEMISLSENEERQGRCAFLDRKDVLKTRLADDKIVVQARLISVTENLKVGLITTF